MFSGFLTQGYPTFLGSRFTSQFCMMWPKYQELVKNTALGQFWFFFKHEMVGVVSNYLAMWQELLCQHVPKRNSSSHILSKSYFLIKYNCWFVSSDSGCLINYCIFIKGFWTVGRRKGILLLSLETFQYSAFREKNTFPYPFLYGVPTSRLFAYLRAIPLPLLLKGRQFLQF